MARPQKNALVALGLTLALLVPTVAAARPHVRPGQTVKTDPSTDFAKDFDDEVKSGKPQDLEHQKVESKKPGHKHRHVPEKKTESP